MKRSLLAMLMVAALVLPALAVEKGNIDLDVKVGLAVNPSIKLEQGGESATKNLKTTFALGADCFYNINPSLALGLGVNNIFNSEVDGTDGAKVGYTNIYFAVKPKIAVESDIFNSVYFLGQLGYGIMNLDVDESPDKENGLYWGIGVGTEIMQNFIAELLYSFDYGKIGMGADKADTTYSTLMFNVGYKFAL